jgi:hypothetical protein
MDFNTGMRFITNFVERVNHVFPSARFFSNYIKHGGKLWRSWRHCPASRNIADSIPGYVIEIFHFPAALRSTQPLTEIITRNISLGGKGG